MRPLAFSPFNTPTFKQEKARRELALRAIGFPVSSTLVNPGSSCGPLFQGSGCSMGLHSSTRTVTWRPSASLTIIRAARWIPPPLNVLDCTVWEVDASVVEKLSAFEGCFHVSNLLQTRRAFHSSAHCRSKSSTARRLQSSLVGAQSDLYARQSGASQFLVCSGVQ